MTDDEMVETICRQICKDSGQNPSQLVPDGPWDDDLNARQYREQWRNHQWRIEQSINSIRRAGFVIEPGPDASRILRQKAEVAAILRETTAIRR